MNRPSGIDIIIPIYNAYDDVKRCMESILTSTDLTKHRVLMINDASPDTRILPYLKSRERPNVIALENDKNLGFSGTINHGISYSANRDVILLNSDTIVTKNWVEKLIDCAYSEEAIATVTPLSNNATLCSVPEFLEENKLPVSYTLEQYAALIETVSMHRYPKIPVANGFCMYVKREVIDRIGDFDSATFGRGYGEENDFCYRAEQMGYRHAMCDDTYIYHTGTTSFVSEEKKRYIEAHEKILCERYPDQNHAVAVHCRDNPNGWVQENIKLWTGLLNGRKNLLYLVQSDFREDANDHLGGTQLHVKDMTQIMRSSCNVFVAARNLDYLNLTAYTDTESYYFRFYIGKAPEFPIFRNQTFADLYGNILDAFHIDFVHIHHTKDLTLELFYEAHKRKIPLVTTLHDYYSVCPNIKLINCNGGLCTDKDNRCCSECLESSHKIYKKLDYISLWQAEHLRSLKLSDAIVAPSANAKKILCGFYPELEQKFQVISHGMEPMKREDRSEDSRLHVAFIGGISKEKGSEISCKLIKNGPSDVDWFLFGIWGYNDLSMLDRKNYTKTGLYERHELPGLMEQYKIDLVCILPIWPETYCYTLSEALMCGVPVIATDIGALGERMHELQCGWIVSVEHAYEESLAIINRIKDKNSEYRNMREKVRQIHLKTLEEMGAEYQDLYQKLPILQREYPTSNDLKTFALDGYLIANGKKFCFAADGESLQERLNQTETELQTIKTCFTYKCMKAIGMIPIPGKKYIKKILYAGYRIIRRQ